MEYLYSKKDFELAKRFVDTVLSMDKLYRESSNDTDKSFAKEGIVPAILSEVKYDEIGSWTDIKKLLLSIYEEYKTIDNDIRKSYMFEQISSILGIGEWVFENKKFEYRDLVRDLLFVNHNPISEHQISKQKNALDILLSNKNYRGTFEEKLSSWKKENLVASKDLQGVLDSLAKEAKVKTLNLGFKEIENVDIKCVVEYDAAYSGYCDFLTNTIIINGDLEYTYPGLKHLICHETHPGHMTHMQVRKMRADNGQIPMDALLVITNSASSGVFEGLADNGADFIGWLETEDDLIARKYQILSSSLNVNLAYKIHQENMNIADAKKYYQDNLTANEAQVNSKVRFVTFPFRRPFTYAYLRGCEAVENVYNRVPKFATGEFLRYAYNNMHSVNTISQFV